MMANRQATGANALGMLAHLLGCLIAGSAAAMADDDGRPAPGAPPMVGLGDADAGARLFHTCRACHSIDRNDNDNGPHLAGLFGRLAGSLSDYAGYSHALAQADFMWTPERMNAWLADPNGFLPGNRMNFAGLRNADDRADLIAYLRQATQ